MESTRLRYFLASDDIFKARVLILAIQHGQDIMNIIDSAKEGEPPDADLAKLKQKAQELLNNPDSFKERLALSVAAMLDDSDVTTDVLDYKLDQIIVDAFDGLAGVSSARESRLVRSGDSG